MARVSLRVEQNELRARMRAVGMTHEEAAVEFARRYRLRPRAAFRHAFGWTLQEATNRSNAHATRTGVDPDGMPVMSPPRLSEVENWPFPDRRRPTPQVLALLAAVYGTDVHRLVDLEDRERLSRQDQLLLDRTRRDIADSDRPAHGNAGVRGLSGQRGTDRVGPMAYDLFRHEQGNGGAPQPMASAGETGFLDGDEEERLRRAVSRPSRVDGRVVASLAAILAEQRSTEDLIGSARLLVPVVAQLGEVERLIGEASGRVRGPLVEIGAQWAEFAGWLHISTGRWTAARSWLDRAAEWAFEVDATTLHATTVSFKGHLVFHLGQLDAAVGLSRAASRDERVWVGQRAYDAHQEARAHALAGRRRPAVEALARGADLAAAAAADGEAAPAWIYYYTPEFYALERGWVCRYLGRDDPAYNEEAIVCLTRGLAGLGDARTSGWAAEFLCHLAAAYLQADSPDLAGTAGIETAAIIAATGSVRLLPRLRRLHADLAARWPGSPTTADLGEALRLGRDGG
ncbi:helix-turn-helix transcriptional regulator [Parafrankia sp. FMc6]|uniref:helix-turn-helix domain-containing protein n=1 Tax=Parafrankia soli TaxID=2599596 RepID=UPI0034D54EEF